MPLKSFISEHSAEYVLVPDLIGRLASAFPEITPIFFWSTREGNTITMDMMSDKPMRLLSVFARRPKIALCSSDKITMKVNRELFDYTHSSVDAGIAVLAGIPLVSSLTTLRVNSPCCWYELKSPGKTKAVCDHAVEMTLDGTVISNDASPNLLHGPLTDVQILKVSGSSLILPWADIVERLRRVRSEQSRFQRFPFFNSYKPFHLILGANSASP